MYAVTDGAAPAGGWHSPHAVGRRSSPGRCRSGQVVSWMAPSVRIISRHPIWRFEAGGGSHPPHHDKRSRMTHDYKRARPNSSEYSTVSMVASRWPGSTSVSVTWCSRTMVRTKAGCGRSSSSRSRGQLYGRRAHRPGPRHAGFRHFSRLADLCDRGTADDEYVKGLGSLQRQASGSSLTLRTTWFFTGGINLR